LNNRIDWLARILFIFVSFFAFQSSITFPFQTDYNFIEPNFEHPALVMNDCSSQITGRHFPNSFLSFSEASEPENARFALKRERLRGLSGFMVNSNRQRNGQTNFQKEDGHLNKFQRQFQKGNNLMLSIK